MYNKNICEIYMYISHIFFHDEKLQLFVVKKWEKYILPDRKMYVKYICKIFLRIYFVFIKKIYFNYITFRQLYM